jgi:tetratricopeptide (TPR) repeat protein
MKRLDLRIAAVALTLGTAAAASPPVWDAVREPGLAQADEALRIGEAARAPRHVPRGLDPKIDALLDHQAAVLIEMARGTTKTPELAFLYGDSLLGARAGRESEARDVLLATLQEFPDHPQAAHAWFGVAIASNLLGDPEQELAAYDRALELEWNVEARSRVHLNRAETRMLTGWLDGARRDYETSLALTTSSEGYALAEWGLAVCLARDGNLPAALDHAGRAAALQFPGPGDRRFSAVELPGVFFTPEHEIHYYRALGLMALARGFTGMDAVIAYEEALGHWDEYLLHARSTQERWVLGAEQQRAYCHRRLEVARRDARRLRQPASSGRPRAAEG